MSLFEVVVVLICVGIVLYLFQRFPYVAAPMKQIITWIVIVAVVIWLVTLTGILAKFEIIKFPHV